MLVCVLAVLHALVCSMLSSLFPPASLLLIRAWSEKTSMSAVTLDFTPGNKNAVSINSDDFFKEGFKIYLFGTVTMENGPKALEAGSELERFMKCVRVCVRVFIRLASQVATATLGGQSVKLYLHQQGYDKLTSTIPCAAYLMKMIPDPETQKQAKNAIRSVLVVSSESKVLKFSVACTGCIYGMYGPHSALVARQRSPPKQALPSCRGFSGCVSA